MNGFAETREPDALIARTAKHFAHKVAVTASDGRASIETRFGRADLTATDDGISIALTPDGAEAGDRLREVIASHLTRFARAPIDVRWS